MHTADEAELEKRKAAAASVVAAVVLTALKLAVGLATNSLGVLSEAAHSGLDLLAAAVTYAAVRYSSFPPDPGHPYGHGKMENLSALVESLLLFITCGWIIHEAADRLFFTPVAVKPTLWALGVMLISIVVDISRSRMLLRVAKKYRSQALEADAMHFSTDILSSGVVVVGLLALYAAAALPEGSLLRAWLERADALAALGVSAIVIRISWSLGKRAVNVLLDAGDAASAAGIRAALEAMPGLRGIKTLRLRHSGPDLFVDLTLAVAKGLIIDEVEAIRARVDAVVRGIAEHAEVSVVFVPQDEEATEAPDRIMRLRGLAAVHGLLPHAVEILDLGPDKKGAPQRLVELHLEFSPEIPLGEAHAKVSVFEAALRAEEEGIIIVTHLEPMEGHGSERLATGADSERIRLAVRRIVANEPLVRDEHNVLVRSYGEGRCVSFHCRMDPKTAVGDAHAASVRLQAALHAALPELVRVTVHMEPFRGGAA